MKFSEKIVFMRKKRGISQDRLASKMGVSRQTVYKWEADLNTPEFNKIEKLAEILNISYDLLLDDSIDLEKYFNENKEIIKSNNEQDAVKNYSFNRRRLVLTIIITLAIVAVIVAAAIILANRNADSYDTDTSTNTDTASLEKLHNWGDWREIYKGNCYTPQLLERECFICGEKETMEGEILEEHSYVDGVCEKCIRAQYTQGVEYTVDNGAAYVSSYYGADEIVSISPYYIPEGEDTKYPVTGIKELNSFIIKELVIPEGVAIIGGNQFNCPNLEVLRIPATLEKIHANAFELCIKLSRVYISDIKSWCQVTAIIKKADEVSIFPCSYDMYLDNQLLTDLHITSDMYCVNSYAFANCKSLKTLTMAEDSENARSIGKRAFYCSGLEYAQIDCTAMEEKAFAFCYNLKSVKIMARALVAYDNVFDHCYHLIEVYTNGGILPGDTYKLGGVAEYARIVHNSFEEQSVLTKTNDGYIFARINEKNYLVEYTGNDSIMRLPRSFNGEEYTIIENFNFAGSPRVRISEIHIPKEILYIEKNAFMQKPSVMLYFEASQPYDSWEQKINESEYVLYDHKLDY